MAGCCATGCTHTSKKNPELSFHRFPADEQRNKLWALRANQSNEDGSLWMPNFHILCSVSALADRRQLVEKYRSAKDTISSLQREVAQVGSHVLQLDRIGQLLIYI